MGLDKLNLTVFEPPDSSLLDEIGIVREDPSRRNLYKYFVDLGHCQIMWHPHKFGPKINERIGYTKLDFSPKHFPSFSDLENSLRQYFYSGNGLPLSRFEVSRIDIKADIENLPIPLVLGRMFRKGLRDTSFNYFKGTIYMGYNPRTRIYDKTSEIKARQAKGRELLALEKEILESEKKLTRFEVMIKRPQFTLDRLAQEESTLIEYFDRIDFYDFEDALEITEGGGLQMLLKNARREFRKNLEEFKSEEISQRIKNDFLAGFREWMRPKAGINDIPF